MSGTLTLWVVIVAVGLSNYLSRLSFIALFARVDMPPFAARALRYVPAAMLTAIVVPAVVFATPGSLDFGWSNPRLIGALVASAVAWRWRNVTATMAAGMVALWLAQWALRAVAG